MNVATNAIAALTGSVSDTRVGGSPPDKEAKKQLAAAQDFESILIGQMLHSVREQGEGWLGTGDDDASASAFGFGEDQLAKALTKGGGLGLAKVIATGLAAKSAAAEKSAVVEKSAVAEKSAAGGSSAETTAHP
jgi:flagellar protein FlgJ